MDFPSKIDNLDVRAYARLLKAHIETKANLNYQISLAKIRNSYYQANTDHRDIKDLIATAKILNKRLQEYKNLKKSVESVEVQPIRSNSIRRLHSFSPVNFPKVNLKDLQNNDLERSLKELKEKYSNISKVLEDKTEQYQINQYKIKKSLKSQKILAMLQEEIERYKSEINSSRYLYILASLYLSIIYIPCPLSFVCSPVVFTSQKLLAVPSAYF
jgi:ATP-dependent exoDNAse (exonuclease V) beta subunit